MQTSQNWDIGSQGHESVCVQWGQGKVPQAPDVGSATVEEG